MALQHFVAICKIVEGSDECRVRLLAEAVEARFEIRKKPVVLGGFQERGAGKMPRNLDGQYRRLRSDCS